MTRRLHAVEQSQIEELGVRDAYISPAAANEREASDAALRPLQRLQLLCDEGSLNVMRSSAISERMGDRARPATVSSARPEQSRGGRSTASRRT